MKYFQILLSQNNDKKLYFSLSGKMKTEKSSPCFKFVAKCDALLFKISGY